MALAIQLSPQNGSNCAYLSHKIYCYGGSTGAGDSSSDNDVLMALDINSNNKEATPYQNLNSQWQPIPMTTTTISLGKRSAPHVASLLDGKRLMIYGGYNNNATSKLSNQAVLYNAESNHWESLPNFNDAANGGDRQIYNGTAVSVPHLNAIGFYGGYEEHVQIESGYTLSTGAKLSNLTFTNVDGISNSYVGFYYFTLFDLNLNTWTTPQQYNPPLTHHTALTSTYHPDSKRIIYMGGAYYDPTGSRLFTNLLNRSMIFDTTNGQWIKQDLLGATVPRPRTMHTATLLPDGNTILLYGGTGNGINATADYCYTLDVPTMTWTRQSLIAPLGTSSGPRFQHSAVLVENAVFILFGIDKDANPTFDLLVLDVRNVGAIQFSSKYPLDASGSSNSNSNGSSSHDGTGAGGGKDKSGLSSGATIGIAVGCSIVGVLLVAVCIFVMRRARQQRRHTTARQHGDDTYGPSSLSNHHDVSTATKQQEHEMMQVDWDKIEKIDPPHQFIVKSTSSNDVTKPSVDSNLNMTLPDVVVPVEKPDGK
ncbi:uncharacterized protein ATC70_012909 [Mucor velutinosus]|uniref:Galactose oxidase n=1 Tax=Mucor velutinosus TaxID=708070 RepID=A0AAN7DC69_9FUNG|nr:hypothetical protein ATC70_012909 [Mucor velutinosus]